MRLEELSFAEQVRLVGSASILVGNHGAGLTNIAWLAPGSRVLELRRRGDGQNNCFFSLASALDVAYSYNLCDSVEDRESTHSADLLVDPQMLDETLESISD